MNYSDAKIYIITCHITRKKYIGSTCKRQIEERISLHRNLYKSWQIGKANKCSSFDIIKHGDYSYQSYSFPCRDRLELLAEEALCVSYHDDVINKNKPGAFLLSGGMKSYQKNYYLVNKERLKASKLKRKNVI